MHRERPLEPRAPAAIQPAADEDLARRQCRARLFEQAPELFELLVDLQDRVVHASESLQRRLGRDAASLNGMPISSLLADGAARVVSDVTEVEGRVTVMHFGNLAGEPFSMRTAAAPWGNGTLLVGVLTTECERNEQQQLHAVNNELAVVSRELVRQRRQLETLVSQARAREAQLQLDYQTIERIARTDPLTGLSNRRVLDEELPHILERSFLDGRQVSILVIDLDHFKRVNDTLGHDAGDLVLGEVAAVIRRSIRGDDLAVRLGGEELMVVLPGAGSDRALAISDDLRLRIAGVSLGPATGCVTASIGIATWTDPAESLAALLARADAAMYRAKATGRNRCVVAPPATVNDGR